jgi:hypothetical protein
VNRSDPSAAARSLLEECGLETSDLSDPAAVDRAAEVVAGGGRVPQMGLLDPQGLPVAGVEQARKLLDKHLPTNALMATGASSP